MSKSVAIITARGGSKRIPRKNIRPFLGSPIIKYSIEAAIKSGCFDEVMVSTDDMEIADVALSFGASIPFMRSAKNSDDYSTTADVIAEVINEYKKSGKTFEHLCCIYPTAPFVTAEKLKNAMSMLLKEGADCVLPVVRYSYPIQRSLKIENGKAYMLWPENYLARSQDLTPVYHDCGQFYCMKTTSLLEQMKLFAVNTIPLITPEEEVQDIDNEEDWKLAEIKYKIIHDKTNV
jgi:N-acylneuraminate cytidylyltransferase